MDSPTRRRGRYRRCDTPENGGVSVTTDNTKRSSWYYPGVPKISVEIPQELLDDLNEHVGDDGKFVNRSDAIRASIRKTLDIMDDIDARHGRITDERSGE